MTGPARRSISCNNTQWRLSIQPESPLLRSPVVAALRKRIRGAIHEPCDPDYSVARRVWNAAIDRQPGAIIMAADAEDVALAVRISSDHGVSVTVRGGGHNVAGRAVADGALMVDLSGMRDVVVNAKSRTASVQGGALWHDIDVATARCGLVTTGGLISSTGVGGFTLGGGAGWLMRRHGLAIDNLQGAGVILADGRFVRASSEEHPELFWALRGGAGGFGVVTNFDFKLHPLKQVLAGAVIRPLAEAGATLRDFRDLFAEAPDDLGGMAVLAHAPSLPFLDAAWHGKPVVAVMICWCGDPTEGERILEPLRRRGAPLADHIGPIPYVQWQHLQDPNAPLGRYQYWKTASFAHLDDIAIDTLLEGLGDGLPTRHSEIHIQPMGGAVARVPADDTAFASRHAQVFINFIGTTPWPAEFDRLRDRVRRLCGLVAPYALTTLLPNFANRDDGDVTLQADTSQGQRLATLRRQFDSRGMFVRE